MEVDEMLKCTISKGEVSFRLRWPAKDDGKKKKGSKGASEVLDARCINKDHSSVSLHIQYDLLTFCLCLGVLLYQRRNQTFPLLQLLLVFLQTLSVWFRL